jgi:hypothetical protein
MRVLLINPNRFRTPPVPPLGLEYVAGSLIREGHQADIADLCFAEDMGAALDSAVSSTRPDLVGITVRNIDSVLYHTNEFFLDDIASLVSRIKSRYGMKVLLGGAGVKANPEGVLNYLGADFALVGPAEGNVSLWCESIHEGRAPTRIVHGRFDAGAGCPRAYAAIDYARYFGAGGIAGFETHKGCSSSCVYCLEANTAVSFRNAADVITEIRTLADLGYRHFHLCDSEFNEDLDFCLDFCTALRNAGCAIAWTAYMKPAQFNRKLFTLMGETGAYLVTLTVDSVRKCPEYWADVEKFVFLGRSSGMKIAVDFLTGFPGEDEDLVRWCLDLFWRIQPDSVNINTYIRLYAPLRVTDIIMRDAGFRARLLGDVRDESRLTPVFYSHLPSERMKELTGGESLFRLEGLQQGVNYLRVRA